MKIPIIFLFFMLLLHPDFSFAVNVGEKAPDFRIVSGDDKELTLGALSGKVIIMFYETKNIVEKNRPLKNALEGFCNSLPETLKGNVVSLPVINCSSSGIFINVWKNALINNSKKEGMTIYGDWFGKMFKDYAMTDKESNFLIIDKKGIIRYINKGKISEQEFKAIEDLLGKLLNPV